jgi:hypothetical protein
VSSAIFYLDESGDLGWNFTAPYRNGGSSRYLTIATLVCPQDKKQYPKRLIIKLYEKFNWNIQKEKKWADMIPVERECFAQVAQKLMINQLDIKLFAITVVKEKVGEHIRVDSNKLYNYMIGLSLIDEMARYDNVVLVPDERGIKVKSGNSLHDYLGINLAFEKKVKTMLTTSPCNSALSKSVQFADMLAGLVQNHYEDANNRYWQILHPHITIKRLFFPS